jgi:protein involved in polysaccharide export with SLBB domain
VKVSLKDLIESSDLSRNIWIGPNDIVHVNSTGPRTILVFGYVNSPGLKMMPAGERLGLLDAVGLAGGLSTHARSEYSYLLRRDDTGNHYYRVDLTRIASGSEPDTVLHPRDVLVVGTSWPIRFFDGILGGGGVVTRFIPTPTTP